MRTKRCGFLVLLAGWAALLWSAGCQTAPAIEANLGVETIEEALPIFDGRRMRDPDEADDFPPMRVLLARSRFWAQDKHLDVVVQMNEREPEGELRVRILDTEGGELSRFALSPVPAQRFAFYPAIPPALADGGGAVIETVWADGDQTLAEDRQAFVVKVAHVEAERSGRIPLRIPNPEGVSQRGIPATVGVPFPRGILDDTANLRLVDRDGREIPLQIMETARWSKFGPVKWVLCDFVADLEGEPLEVFLKYGPNVRRRERADLSAEPAQGFPRVDAGRLRFDGGLWYDPAGDGNFVKVLGEQALAGAFVEHEDGRIYRMPAEAEWDVEESGPEKVVLKRKGYYVAEEEGREFCQFIVRCVIHRDSPFVRIFHTWVFTGDGNRDRIANMGWQFDLAEGLAPQGFLTAFDEGGQWTPADYLLQWDYEHFDLVSGGERTENPGGRAAGTAMASGDGVRLYFGARDFWQNYPSELEFADGSLWFNNWPRHNRPAGYTFEGEIITSPGEAAPASAARHEQYEPGRLTRSEWKLNLGQARFAHEGEVLDFRLPDRAAEDPIRSRVILTQPPSTHDWKAGEPESINAQGIARTEEMWLYLAPEDGEDGTAERVLEGLNDETLRAKTDPAWLAQSGAFYEIHHQDRANYPEEESLFEQLALAPGRWQEELGMYGMWLHGDMFLWARVSLDRREPAMYRALRKGHHGWPYSWIPYARSGDPRLLRLASAAARQNMDANYTNYVSDDLRRRTEASFSPRTRRIGLWNVGPLAWAGQRHPQSRSMHNKVDWVLHAWYLTGYHRAKDYLSCWAEQAKNEEPMSRRGPVSAGDRNSMTMLQSSVETYEATFDPWFLAAAHAIAEGHRRLHEEEGYTGHFYQSGDREFLRFSGDLDFRDYYMAYADTWGGHWETPSWQLMGNPMVESNAYAWHLTGEEYYLRRVEHFLDWLKAALWDGDEPERYRGYYARGTSHAPPMYTGWTVQYFPLALAALEQAGQRLDPVPDLLQIEARNPVIAMRKQPGQPATLRLRSALRRFPSGTAQYIVKGPDGSAFLEGEWQTEETKNLEIPADAPDGVYRLEVSGARSFVVPAVKQIDVPEVLLFEPEQEVVLGQMKNQVWFRVPEDAEEFSVQIPLDEGHPLEPRRLSIWGPDGERAWDLNYHREYYEGEDPVRVVVPVEPGQAGRLWRVTLPNSAARFQMDPKVEPVYSLCRTRWFDPAEAK